jgi:hypothetical protein
LLSDVNGKFYNILYFSVWFAAFSIVIVSAVLSNNFIFNYSASLTKATSSGDEAWYIF